MTDLVDEAVDQLVERLLSAERAVALTGAGVSTESGIPDFRSASSGLWDQHDPMEVASLDGFLHDPRKFYGFWADRFGALGTAEPNIAHETLAALQRSRRLMRVITQNIDGLHGDAGSADVLEVHGTYRNARCLRCGYVVPLSQVLEDVRARGGAPPTCERCGKLIKPDVVLFGEDLPPAFRTAEQLATKSDFFLVLGSSLAVYPVAGLVPLAKETGAYVAIINREPGPFDDLADLVIHSDLGPTMARLKERLALKA